MIPVTENISAQYQLFTRGKRIVTSKVDVQIYPSPDTVTMQGHQHEGDPIE